jgi:arylsulfatase A-like enzyme
MPEGHGENTAPARPNIVLIVADDMGFTDIGCFGSEIPTPNLDRMSRRGARFSQMYNGARCCPSRAALLTGVYAQQAGMAVRTRGDHRRSPR